MKLKVLITGALGQVGRALTNLPDQEHEFIGLSRAELDLTSSESIERAMIAHAPDVVVNTAAYTAVDRAEDDLEQAFRVNAKGPGHLAQACLRHGVVLIHISTDYVFDGSLGRPAREEDPCIPVGVYGQSKFAGEEAIRVAGVPHICLRTSWVFSGAGPCFPRAILKAAKNQNTLRVVDDQLGGPTSALSLAQVIRCMINRIAQRDEMIWGTYHFAQGPYCSWFDFAQTILQLAAREDRAYAQIAIEPVSTEVYGARAPRPTDSRLNTDKIRLYFNDVNIDFAYNSDLRAAVQEIVGTLNTM